VIAHPAAKKLFILDESRNAMHVLPLDVVKALDAKGIDYLFVESTPITSITTGKVYEYPIKVLSKLGKLKFMLDSGPEKMTISETGVLRWEVPKNFDEEKTSVIVTIEDGAKQSILHTFVITVDDKTRKPVAKPKSNSEMPGNGFPGGPGSGPGSINGPGGPVRPIKPGTPNGPKP
jgi:hypothetical protein